MKRSFIAVALLAMLALVPALHGCATGSGTVLGSTPEAQIAKGANAHTAATTLATVLLRNDKITVSQAKGFRVLLGASNEALHEANTSLLACRKTTGSTDKTSPDPCWLGVTDLISLALNGIDGVQKALASK